jgi:hypothetical protein
MKVRFKLPWLPLATTLPASPGSADCHMQIARI